MNPSNPATGWSDSRRKPMKLKTLKLTSRTGNETPRLQRCVKTGANLIFVQEPFAPGIPLGVKCVWNANERLDLPRALPEKCEATFISPSWKKKVGDSELGFVGGTSRPFSTTS